MAKKKHKKSVVKKPKKAAKRPVAKTRKAEKNAEFKHADIAFIETWIRQGLKRKQAEELLGIFTKDGWKGMKAYLKKIKKMA